MTNPVIIISPGLFNRAQKLAAKSDEISKLSPDVAARKLRNLQHGDFYTNTQLFALFKRAGVSFKLTEVSSIHRLLDFINGNVDKLDKNDLKGIFNCIAVNDEVLIDLLNCYPGVAKQLQPETLEKFCLRSAKVAKHVMSNDILLNILDRKIEARYRIYKKHKYSLWLCDRVFKHGLKDVVEEVHVRSNDPMVMRDYSDIPEWPSVATLIEERRAYVNEKRALEEKIQKCHMLLKAINEKILLEQEKQQLEQKTLQQSNIDNHEQVKFQNQLKAQREVIEWYKRELGLHNEQEYNIKQKIVQCNNEIGVKQQSINNTIIRLREISEKIQSGLGKRSLDIFLRNQATEADRSQSRENMFELIRMRPRYMTLIDRRHIQGMFALIESEQEFLWLFIYLASDKNTLHELKAFLSNVKTLADRKISKLSIAQRAYINAAYYIYDKGVLFKQEHENGHRVLSSHPSVVAAIYEGKPKRFVQHFNLITNTEDRLLLLQMCRSSINGNDLIALTTVITNPKERKRYFLDDKRDSSGLTPLAKLRQSIDGLINPSHLHPSPINLNDHKTLLSILSQNDLRGWIDIARQRRDDSINYVRHWLEYAPSSNGKYNDDVAKIIAHDKRLLSTIRPNNVMNQKDKDNSLYLFAADYVLTKITEFNRWYDWKSKDRFVEFFIAHFINNSDPVLSGEKLQAVCWYIANDKDLWKRLVEAYVRVPGWIWGPSQQDAENDRAKLAGLSKHFKDKFISAQPEVAPIDPPEQLPTNILQFLEKANEQPELKPQLLDRITSASHALVLASVAKPTTKIFITQLFKESNKLADLLVDVLSKENIDQLTDHLEHVFTGMQTRVPPRQLTAVQLITLLPLIATMKDKNKQLQLESMLATLTIKDENFVIDLLNALVWTRDSEANKSYFNALFDSVSFVNAFENVDLILKILAFKQHNTAFVQKYKSQWERLLNNRNFVTKLNYEQLQALLTAGITTGLKNIEIYNTALVRERYETICEDKIKLSEELKLYWPLYENIYNERISEIDEDELTLLFSIDNPACQYWLATRFRPTPEQMVQQFAKLDRSSISRHIHLIEKAVTQKFLESLELKDVAKLFSADGSTTELIKVQLETFFKQNYSNSMRFLETGECDQTLVSHNIDLFLPELASPDFICSERALKKLYQLNDTRVMPFIFGQKYFATVIHWLTSNESPPTAQQLKFLLSMIADGKGAEVLIKTTVKPVERLTVASPILAAHLTSTIKQLFVEFDGNKELIVRLFKNPDAQQLFAQLNRDDIVKLAAVEDLIVATGILATFKNKSAFINFHREGFIYKTLQENDKFMLALLNDDDLRHEVLVNEKHAEKIQQQLFVLYKRNNPAITKKLLALSNDKKIGFDLGVLTGHELYTLYSHHVFDAAAIAHIYAQQTLREKFLSALPADEHHQFYFNLLKTADAELVADFFMHTSDLQWLYNNASLMYLLTHNHHCAKHVLMNKHLRDKLGITQHHLQYVLGLIIKQPEKLADFFKDWSDKKFISDAFIQAVWNGHLDKIALFLQTPELQQLFDKEHFAQSILGKPIVVLSWLSTCGKQFENQLRNSFPSIMPAKLPSLPEKSSLVSNMAHAVAEIVPIATSPQKIQEALLKPIQKDIKALYKQLDKEKGDKKPFYNKLLIALYEYRLSNNNIAHEKEREIKLAFFNEMGNNIHNLLNYCLDNEVKKPQALYLILEGQHVNNNFNDVYQMQMLMDPILCPLLNANNIVNITDKYPQQRLFCLTHVHTLLVLAKEMQSLLELAKNSGLGRTDKEVAEVLIRLVPIASDKSLADLFIQLKAIAEREVLAPSAQHTAFTPAVHVSQAQQARGAAFFGQQRTTPVTDATRASQATTTSPEVTSLRMNSDG